MAKDNNILRGLDKIHVAKITYGEDGTVTYGTPTPIANAMELQISPQTDTANIFADDTLVEKVDVKSAIEVELTLAGISNANLRLLLGKEVDSNGVTVDSDSDIAPDFALGFRSDKGGGNYRYVWLRKGNFSAPEETFGTKSDSADTQNISLAATFMKDEDGVYSYKVDSNDSTVSQAVIDAWFTTVYERVTGTAV